MTCSRRSGRPRCGGQTASAAEKRRKKSAPRAAPKRPHAMGPPTPVLACALHPLSCLLPRNHHCCHTGGTPMPSPTGSGSPPTCACCGGWPQRCCWQCPSHCTPGQVLTAGGEGVLYGNWRSNGGRSIWRWGKQRPKGMPLTGFDCTASPFFFFFDCTAPPAG